MTIDTFYIIRNKELEDNIKFATDRQESDENTAGRSFRFWYNKYEKAIRENNEDMIESLQSLFRNSRSMGTSYLPVDVKTELLHVMAIGIYRGIAYENAKDK